MAFNLLDLFRSPSAGQQEVRAEIWRLGSRHRGEPLAGALAELQDADLPAARAELLRACVRTLKTQ